MQSAKVANRKRELDGSFKGKAHANPILDTRTYEVEFPDGQTAEFAANVIAESMYTQCDTEGNQYLLMKSIIDHRKDDDAIGKEDMYIQSNPKGNKHLRKTTKGWKLCAEWKDGSTSWARLADLKESNPNEMAEYAVSHNTDDEPAFAWWAPHTLKKRHRIVAAVNKRHHKRTHKCGIEMPETVHEALELDRKNSYTLWQDVLKKELNNVSVALEWWSCFTRS